MRLIALVALVMCAFAANSILNRIGVAIQGMDPMNFATVRTGAGASMLWLLVSLRKAPRADMLALRATAHMVVSPRLPHLVRVCDGSADGVCSTIRATTSHLRNN